MGLQSHHPSIEADTFQHVISCDNDPIMILLKYTLPFASVWFSPCTPLNALVISITWAYLCFAESLLLLSEGIMFWKSL